MSGSKARQKRRAIREQPEVERNADFALAAAKRVLNTDLDAVQLDRVTQFVIGWVRAAFDQSNVIATLTRGGLAHAAAPNRRMLAELVVRLQWLYTMPQKDRASALDALLDDERDLTKRALNHLQEMSKDMDYTPERDLTRMYEVVLEAAGGALKNQARSFVDAAKSTHGQSLGLYYAWREETQFSHATGSLAFAYAPATQADPFPPVADPNLKTHLFVLLLVVSLARNLLVDEGVEPDVAMRMVEAFLSSN